MPIVEPPFANILLKSPHEREDIEVTWLVDWVTQNNLLAPLSFCYESDAHVTRYICRYLTIHDPAPGKSVYSFHASLQQSENSSFLSKYLLEAPSAAAVTNSQPFSPMSPVLQSKVRCATFEPLSACLTDQELSKICSFTRTSDRPIDTHTFINPWVPHVATHVTHKSVTSLMTPYTLVTGVAASPCPEPSDSEDTDCSYRPCTKPSDSPAPVDTVIAYPNPPIIPAPLAPLPYSPTGVADDYVAIILTGAITERFCAGAPTWVETTEGSADAGRTLTDNAHTASTAAVDGRSSTATLPLAVSALTLDTNTPAPVIAPPQPTRCRTLTAPSPLSLHSLLPLVSLTTPPRPLRELTYTAHADTVLLLLPGAVLRNIILRTGAPLPYQPHIHDRLPPLAAVPRALRALVYASAQLRVATGRQVQELLRGAWAVVLQGECEAAEEVSVDVGPAEGACAWSDERQEEVGAGVPVAQQGADADDERYNRADVASPTDASSFVPHPPSRAPTVAGASGTLRKKKARTTFITTHAASPQAPAAGAASAVYANAGASGGVAVSLEPLFVRADTGAPVIASSPSAATRGANAASSPSSNAGPASVVPRASAQAASTATAVKTRVVRGKDRDARCGTQTKDDGVDGVERAIRTGALELFEEHTRPTAQLTQSATTNSAPVAAPVHAPHPLGAIAEGHAPTSTPTAVPQPPAITATPAAPRRTPSRPKQPADRNRVSSDADGASRSTAAPTPRISRSMRVRLGVGACLGTEMCMLAMRAAATPATTSIKASARDVGTAAAGPQPVDAVLSLDAPALWAAAARIAGVTSKEMRAMGLPCGDADGDTATSSPQRAAGSASLARASAGSVSYCARGDAGASARGDTVPVVVFRARQWALSLGALAGHVHLPPSLARALTQYRTATSHATLPDALTAASPVAPLLPVLSVSAPRPVSLLLFPAHMLAFCLHHGQDALCSSRPSSPTHSVAAAHVSSSSLIPSSSSGTTRAPHVAFADTLAGELRARVTHLLLPILALYVAARATLRPPAARALSPLEVARLFAVADASAFAVRASLSRSRAASAAANNSAAGSLTHALGESGREAGLVLPPAPRSTATDAAPHTSASSTLQHLTLASPHPLAVTADPATLAAPPRSVPLVSFADSQRALDRLRAGSHSGRKHAGSGADSQSNAAKQGLLSPRTPRGVGAPAFNAASPAIVAAEGHLAALAGVWVPVGLGGTECAATESVSAYSLLRELRARLRQSQQRRLPVFRSDDGTPRYHNAHRGRGGQPSRFARVSVSAKEAREADVFAVPPNDNASERAQPHVLYPLPRHRRGTRARVSRIVAEVIAAGRAGLSRSANAAVDDLLRAVGVGADAGTGVHANAVRIAAQDVTAASAEACNPTPVGARATPLAPSSRQSTKPTPADRSLQHPLPQVFPPVPTAPSSSPASSPTTPCLVPLSSLSLAISPSHSPGAAPAAFTPVSVSSPAGSYVVDLSAEQLALLSPAVSATPASPRGVSFLSRAASLSSSSFTCPAGVGLTASASHHQPASPLTTSSSSSARSSLNLSPPTSSTASPRGSPRDTSAEGSLDTARLLPPIVESDAEPPSRPPSSMPISAAPIPGPLAEKPADVTLVSSHAAPQPVAAAPCAPLCHITNIAVSTTSSGNARLSPVPAMTAPITTLPAPASAVDAPAVTPLPLLRPHPPSSAPPLQPRRTLAPALSALGQPSLAASLTARSSVAQATSLVTSLTVRSIVSTDYASQAHTRALKGDIRAAYAQHTQGPLTASDSASHMSLAPYPPPSRAASVPPRHTFHARPPHTLASPQHPRPRYNVVSSSPHGTHTTLKAPSGPLSMPTLSPSSSACHSSPPYTHTAASAAFSSVSAPSPPPCDDAEDASPLVYVRVDSAPAPAPIRLRALSPAAHTDAAPASSPRDPHTGLPRPTLGAFSSFSHLPSPTPSPAPRPPSGSPPSSLSQISANLRLRRPLRPAALPLPLNHPLATQPCSFSPSPPPSSRPSSSRPSSSAAPFSCPSAPATVDRHAPATPTTASRVSRLSTTRSPAPGWSGHPRTPSRGVTGAPALSVGVLHRPVQHPTIGSSTTHTRWGQPPLPSASADAAPTAPLSFDARAIPTASTTLLPASVRARVSVRDAAAIASRTGVRHCFDTSSPSLPSPTSPSSRTSANTPGRSAVELRVREPMNTLATRVHQGWE